MKAKGIIYCLISSIYLSVANACGQENVKRDYILTNFYYPVTVGNNFINSGYKGVVSIEFGYYYNLKGNLFAGLNFEYGRLFLKERNLNVEVLKPSLSFNYHASVRKFSVIPQLNIGYSKWRFFSETITGSDVIPAPSFYASQNGLSIMPSIALSYPISSRISIIIQFKYEFTRLERLKGNMKSSYNQNIQLFYPGVGMTIVL